MSVGSSCGHLVQRGPHDGGGEVVGAQVAQRALDGAADRGAGGGDDDGVAGRSTACTNVNRAGNLARKRRLGAEMSLWPGRSAPGVAAAAAATAG